MPENFRANDTNSHGFWFWKKQSDFKKQKNKSEDNPAMDIISQADDIVKKCMLVSDSNKSGCGKSKKKSNTVLLILIAVLIAAALVCIFNIF